MIKKAMEKVISISPTCLEPFSHQVAGQSLVFLYDADTICKSLTSRELRVYKTLPDVLKPHAPQYRGVVDIALTSPNSSTADNDEEKGAKHPLTTQRLLDKLAKQNSHGNIYHFILLENIVAKFQVPCVLDLKLGTRQHGDDAPSHKVHYQMTKCNNTTSAELGVRLCGMKVYNPTEGDYVIVNKAEGRRLSKDDFQEVMHRFLINGDQIRYDIIPPLLLQLRCLKAVIAELPSFRFYSCSLLIVYDGMEENHNDMIVDKQPYAFEAQCEDGDGESDVVTSSSSHRINGSPTSTSAAQKILTSRNEKCDDTNLDQDDILPDASHCRDTGKSIHDNLQENPTEKVSLFDSQSPNVCSTLLLEESEENVVHPVIEDLKFVPRRSQDISIISDSVPDTIDSVPDTIPSTKQVVSESLSFHHLDKKEQIYFTDDCVTDECSRVLEKGLEDVDSLQKPVLCKCNKEKVDVRLVDFAHTTHSGFQEDQVVHKGVDRGCLQGLQTLIDIFSQMDIHAVHG